MKNQKIHNMELAEAHTQGLHTIGETAKLTGLSAKMIRHYESLGLIKPGNRTHANYRVYQMRDIKLLGFIKSARDLGFSMKQIAILASLWQDSDRSSADVKKLAQEHIQEMDERIRLLQQMRQALDELVNRCQGDDRPECPILDAFACSHH